MKVTHYQLFSSNQFSSQINQRVPPSFFYPGATALVGQGLLIIVYSQSHSVGLLWIRDQRNAETSTWQHTTLTRHIHAPGGIRTHNPSKRAAADPRFRSRGPWDWQYLAVTRRKYLARRRRHTCLWLRKRSTNVHSVARMIRTMRDPQQ